MYHIIYPVGQVLNNMFLKVVQAHMILHLIHQKIGTFFAHNGVIMGVIALHETQATVNNEPMILIQLLERGADYVPYYY